MGDLKKDINVEIGERILEKRKYMGLSRSDLSERTGISVQHLSYIEAGRRGMSCSVLQKICQVLCTSADYIVMGERKSLGSDLEEMLTCIDEKYLPCMEDLLKVYANTLSLLKVKLSKDK